MCEAFRGRVKSERKARKLTQPALAEQLDVSPRTVQEWEAGNTHPEFKTLLKIAGIFGRPVGWMLGEETDHPSGGDLGRIEAKIDRLLAILDKAPINNLERYANLQERLEICMSKQGDE